LLRFFRFLAIYGRYPINGDALTACHDLAPRLGELSGERVRGELFRILTAPNPATTISKMIGERVLPYVLPEAGDVGRLRAVAWLVESGLKFEGIEVDPVRRLAALLKPDLPSADVDSVAERLKFSTRERKHLLAITAPHPTITVDITDHDLRLACYKMGKEVVVDRAFLAWGAAVALEAHLPKEQTKAWLHIVETALNWPGAQFPLRGRDVIALGISHGPEIGRILSHVQDWWLENDLKPDHEACLEALKRLITHETHP
jgi:poly(A) polymerase